MTIAHLLEDFGFNPSAEPIVMAMSEEVLDEAKAESFETGYSAGWEDAVTAKDQETNKISATLATSPDWSRQNRRAAKPDHRFQGLRRPALSKDGEDPDTSYQGRA